MAQMKMPMVSGELDNVDLTSMTKSGTKSQMSATVGKKYLVYTSVSVLANLGVDSGATVDSSCVTDDYSAYHLIAIITATASTVVFKGSNNDVWYVQLN